VAPEPAFVGGAAPATQVVDPTNVVPFNVPEDEEERSGPRTGLLIGLALLVLAVIAAGAFFLPRLFTNAPDQVQIPNVVGKTQDQARQAIGDAGLEVGDVSYKPDDSAASDTVLRQSPSGGVGAYADPGTVINLVLSSGKPDVTIQQVVGMSFTDAKELLEGAGLKVRRNNVESDQPKGQVLSTNPAPSTTVASGTTVTVDVSEGPKAVPNVVGMTADEAKQAIRAQGFQPVEADDNASTKPAGTVTKQSPPADSTLKQGSEVVIFVSTYVPPAPPSTPATPPTSPTTCPTPVTLPDGTQTCPPDGGVLPQGEQ
jgi:serine/threonine-protein kinase